MKPVTVYQPGTGSLGPGHCATCGMPWVYNWPRRLWVAACKCAKSGT